MSAEHPDLVTVTYGMSGFFAVLLSWSEDHGGFYEPYTTGFGRYATGDEANAEAKDWAKAEGVKYEPAKVGSTIETEEQRARELSERMKARAARIVELKATGMDVKAAIEQVRKEIPLR